MEATSSRPKERPKNRWEDDVRMDLQKMKIKNWKKSVCVGVLVMCGCFGNVWMFW